MMESSEEEATKLSKDGLWDLFQRFGMDVDVDPGAFPRAAVLLMPTLQADGTLTLGIWRSEGISWIDELGIAAAWDAIRKISYDWRPDDD